MPLTGHVTTAAKNRFGWTAHAVEKSDGELDLEALLVAERVTLPVRDGMKPIVFDTDRDAARDADTVLEAGDRDRDALRVALTVRDGIKPDVMDADRDAEIERERDLEKVLLPVRDGMKPAVLDAERDAKRDADRERDAETDADAVTLKPRVGDVERDRVGETSVHCTYSAKTAPGATQPPDTASVP